MTAIGPTLVTVYAVFGSEEEARRISRALVEERLAACANLLGPCHSIYRWQGRIEEAAEVPVLFKTTRERATEIIARIGELHSYDVPAATIWPIAETLPAYAAWIVENVRR